MATALLTYGGQAAGAYFGPVGAIIGAAAGAYAGSYIDNTYLFPPEAPDVKRLDDLPFQTASEGSPINVCYGPESRIAGTVLWMSEIRAEAIKEEVGGCGLGGGKEVTVGYNYYVDIAIGVCEGEINKIKKIWAEGKIIYAESEDINIRSATTVVCEARTFSYYDNFDQDYLAPAEKRKVMYITSPNGGPDLSEFRSGVDVVTFLWADLDNEGTFLCLESGIDPLVTGGTYVVLLNENAVDEAAGASNKPMDQVLPTFDASMADDIDVSHKGSTTQTADSLIEAAEGAGNVPGFRGIAYVVFENLNVANWGNRVPQMNFLVEKDATITVADTVDAILARTALDAAEYDTNAIAAVNLRGYALTGPKTMKNALEPLMIAYDLIAQENNGVIAFKDRADTTVVSTVTNDLAAHEEGSDTARPLEFTDVMDITLPTEVDVQFLEPGLDYLSGSQRERKITDNVEDNVVNVHLPIVLTASQARIIAKRILWLAWANRQTVMVNLPPSYFHVLENDRISVTTNPETFIILVQSVTRGHNGLLEIEGIIEDVDILDQDVETDEADVFSNEKYIPPSLELSIIDQAPLRTTEMLTPGFYWGACCMDTRIKFPGGAVYLRRAGKNGFKRRTDIKIEMSFGQTLEALPDGITGVWDTVNVIKVRMTEGAPAASTEEEILDGINYAIVGNEILAFRDVSQINATDYELSHLLRGRRNTEKEAGVHAARERFVLLNDDGLYFEPFGISTRKRKYDFKAAALGEDLSAVELLQYESGCNTLRCFSPVHIKAKFNADDELTIYWMWRDRSLFNHFSIAPEDTPFLEPKQQYKIEILDAPDGNVVRTRYVQSPVSYTAVEGVYPASLVYTVGEQVADWGSVQAGYDVRISQYSFRVGYGKPKEEFVP